MFFFEQGPMKVCSRSFHVLEKKVNACQALLIVDTNVQLVLHGTNFSKKNLRISRAARTSAKPKMGPKGVPEAITKTHMVGISVFGMLDAAHDPHSFFALF